MIDGFITFSFGAEAYHSALAAGNCRPLPDYSDRSLLFPMDFRQGDFAVRTLFHDADDRPERRAVRAFYVRHIFSDVLSSDPKLDTLNSFPLTSAAGYWLRV